jgi:hypothetical protein
MQGGIMIVQGILTLWLASLIESANVPPIWSPATQIQTAQANYAKSPKTQVT